jgi:hypothetical protein
LECSAFPKCRQIIQLWIVCCLQELRHYPMHNARRSQTQSIGSRKIFLREVDRPVKPNFEYQLSFLLYHHNLPNENHISQLIVILDNIWWRRRESNLRPTDLKLILIHEFSQNHDGDHEFHAK